MLVASAVRFTHAASDASGPRTVLHGVDLTVGQGETVALVGPSGSGKSTLLYCLSGVLRPQSGSITFRDRDLCGAGDSARAAVRLRHFGFVFQFGTLVPELSLLENVVLPLTLLGTAASPARRRAQDLLDELGVADVAGRRPARVSGGQAQRAAVARALVHEPDVVFADEPTGSLDSASRDVALELLVGTTRRRGAALVIVTHDEAIANSMPRQERLVDGLLTAGSDARGG